MRQPSSSIFQPRRTSTALVLAVASLLLAFGLIALVLIAAFSGGGHDARPGGAAGTGGAVASPSSTPGQATPAPGGVGIGPVTLIQGQKLVNGVYLGYQDTTAGAVSAADQFTVQLLSTLDPDRAAAVARIVAAPSYTVAPDEFAAAAQQDRTSLGLPAQGQVPPGYAQSTVPVMYQLRDESATQVTVLFLCEMSTASPSGGARTELAVIPLAVQWTGGDWRLLPAVSGDAYLNLSAQPDSAAAQAKGWAGLISPRS